MKVVKEFLVIFLVTLVVTALVTYFYNLIFHNGGGIDWRISFTLAIIFGIIFPIIQHKRSL
ncbi:MAG: hypothetical protein ACM3O3_07050 [Syntrophothermus sp.]|nr:hypothetical protein [Ignavibacteriaceae bacterium]